MAGDIPKNELRIPPQNVEAEMSVLGSLMLDKDAIFHIIDALSPEDFYKSTHRAIFEAMLDLFGRHEPIDVVSMTGRLREKGKLEEMGGSAYLTTLVNTVPTASHVQHYAAIVRRKRLLRDLIAASDHIGRLGYQESDDVEQLVDEAEQKIFGIAKHTIRQHFFAVRDALEEAWERIERIHHDRNALRGVTTGFSDLDNILGGLQKSDFVVLAARPSLGKTALALDIARNTALKKNPVGVFSLEMSREQLVDRLIAAEAGVDLWRLRTGHLRSDGPDNDFARVQSAMAILSDAPIYIDDSPSPSIMEIRAKARRLQAEHELNLLIVDYLQLIHGTNTESRVQEVSEISRSLKALAKELNIPVLALSQLSRGVEMRPSSIPKLSDLRESGCLSGDTLITRADTGERLTIQSLVGQKNIPVFSINDKWQLEVKKISHIFSSGHKKLFEVKARSGRTIKASANHPFLTIGGWQRLDTLSVGAHLALPRTLTPQHTSSKLSKQELILLAHLIGDGCVLPRQPIHYTSADPENIDAVKLALTQSLEEINPNPNTDAIPKEVWKLYIEPAKIATGLSWREFSARIDTAYCGNTLFKHGLSRERMTRVAEAVHNPILHTLAQSDVFWEEIISITPLGIEEVFDATVPGNHNFVANDFIVHNSIEQDSDVVMFIYREDKVRENSDRKNIAEIRIEKHRNGPTGKIELYFHEETASFRSIAKHYEEPLG